jgi:hypothetical protein
MFILTAEVMDGLGSQWRAKLIGITSDGAANMAGRFSGWQKLLQNACQSPFDRVHCGPHCINLINGRAIAALRDTSSGWFEKLHVAVKLLRKQANLIETMGSQSPYHVEVRWSSLSLVLQWDRTKADKLQDFYTSAKSKGFSDLAEAPEWWLALCILHEHLSLIKETLTAMKGKEYLLEMQRERLKQPRNDIARLHCIAYRREGEGEVRGLQDGEYSDPENTYRIYTTGNGLETRASLGWFTVNSKDIIAKASEYGLDAREAIEELAEMEEEKVTVAADVAALGLVTVHGISCLNAEVDEVDGQAVSLPPVLPLSLGDLSVVAMQGLVLDMKPRMAVSQPPSLLQFICAEHKELGKALQNSSTLRKRPEDALGDLTAGFDSCWEPLESSFRTFTISPVVLLQFSLALRLWSLTFLLWPLIRTTTSPRLPAYPSRDSFTLDSWSKLYI